MYFRALSESNHTFRPNHLFCIVDIETTGGRAKSHQIIEIGACLHNGHEVVDTYHTYINPGQHIPAFITQLTGITDDKVVDAPYFEDIAQDFMDFLEGHVFVAHNVGFDFSFNLKCSSKASSFFLVVLYFVIVEEETGLFVAFIILVGASIIKFSINGIK